MIKRLRVTVDGNSYDVSVEVPEETKLSTVPVAPAAAAIAAPAASSAPPVAATPPPAPVSVPSGPGAVPSPLAGRVIAVNVQVGQAVKEGDHLITLEAMKMNTFVFAPRAGKVAALNVAVGDAVNEGQALARLE